MGLGGICFGILGVVHILLATLVNDFPSDGVIIINFESNQSIAFVVMRMINSILAVIAGIALLKRSKLVPALVFFGALLCIPTLIIYDMNLPDTFHYWNTVYPWLYIFLVIMTARCFLRKDWATRPPWISKEDFTP